MNTDDRSLQIPPEDIFERARVLVESRHYSSALALLELFEQYKDKREYNFPTKALMMSYMGLCLARAKREYSLGMQICRKAAEMEFGYPDCWLNLGRMHLDYKQRRKAWVCFERGLEINPHFVPILKEMARMGRRGIPSLSFLSRDHAINRFLGKLFRSGKPGARRASSK